MIDEAVSTPAPAASPLAEAICGPRRDALSPSAYRHALRAVQLGLERRFVAALAEARRYVEQAVELAALQAELTRHMPELPCCAQPEFRCLIAADMERRESRLLAIVAGGM